jgi:hypothetical protein
LSISKKTSGPPQRVSRIKDEEKCSATKKTDELVNPLQVKSRRQVKPEQQEEMTETEVIIHSPVDVKDPAADRGRTRNNPLVYEAMEILRSCGYTPVRLTEPTLPINLFGLGRTDDVLILALRSRLPVPNAATLRSLFTRKVDRLRRLAGMVLHKVMIWVYSPACGWRYYLIYPGGLRYDHDFPASMN